MTITPANSTVHSGKTLQFTIHNPRGVGHPAWVVAEGTITARGLYQAPARVTSTHTIEVSYTYVQPANSHAGTDERVTTVATTHLTLSP
jgi:hypothetical protein